YVGTFSRTDALDHEDVEFLSFGHPLVTQALQWAATAHDSSAGLAVCRGFAQEGAVFLWSFGLDLPEDVPEAATFFDTHLYTFALDEAGKRRPELEHLLTDASRPLDRMDAAPLRASINRWQRLCEQNFAAVEGHAGAAVGRASSAALQRAATAQAARRRDLRRSQARTLQAQGKAATSRHALQASHQEALEQLGQAEQRVLAAIRRSQPRLMAALAVRLLRTKHVSG
ncbi:MAG: hypothetical protein EOO40_05750, partial [Deltaproteobacteria bacterium]